jgi:hypothetical protein
MVLLCKQTEEYKNQKSFKKDKHNTRYYFYYIMLVYKC